MVSITCPECHGDGIVNCHDCDGYGCHVCGGAGWVWCDGCDGEGDIDVPSCQEDLDELGIPANADDLTPPLPEPRKD